MKYTLRDDIILEKIDDLYIVVALRSAWDECPFAIQISPTFALIWKQINNGCDEAAILEQLISARGMSKTKAQKLFNLFISKTKKLKYLTVENEPC